MGARTILHTPWNLRWHRWPRVSLLYWYGSFGLGFNLEFHYQTVHAYLGPFEILVEWN